MIPFALERLHPMNAASLLIAAGGRAGQSRAAVMTDWFQVPESMCRLAAQGRWPSVTSRR
ncbi:MAG: hypothetical protein RL227_2017 [Pseudomonadota bacterium]